jgi:thioesterase domain-containing protein
MADENPAEIQFVVPAISARLPLVLLHDGGGTIVSYFYLDELDRPVYGIADPLFNTDRTWEGGIPEMAAHYIGLIRRVIPGKKPFLLGGWSLGGLVSLEIARQMAANNDSSIKAMFFIDSVYPSVSLPGEKTESGKQVVNLPIVFGENTTDATKASVKRSYEQAIRMVREWRPPRWDPDAGIKPPHTILFRAMEAVPVTEDAPENAVARVDVQRDKPKLGWENYGYDLIQKVVDIPGHHFNIFDLKHVDDLSQKLKAACDSLAKDSF